MAEIAGSISRRERGKDARRTRIVDAACALTREVAMADISVKMIADRADVSPATVYNLFGAKGAVIARATSRIRALNKTMLMAVFPCWLPMTDRPGHATAAGLAVKIWSGSSTSRFSESHDC